MIAVVFLRLPRYFSLIFPKFSENISNIFSKFNWIFKIIFSDIFSCIQKFLYRLPSKCSTLKKIFEKKSKNLITASHSNSFSYSPNGNIRHISINNRLDEITNRRYLWSVCLEFTINLANQMWQMNKGHIHSNYTHFFIHTIGKSWRIMHHKHVPHIVLT